MTTNPMTPSGAARVLAAAASIDKRTVGEADAIAWAKTLAWLEPADCIEAVALHYRRTDEYLMPSHIRAIARRILTDRQDEHARTRGIERSQRRSETASQTVAQIKSQLHARKATNE